jgi:hypothetical protein
MFSQYISVGQGGHSSQYMLGQWINLTIHQSLGQQNTPYNKSECEDRVIQYSSQYVQYRAGTGEYNSQYTRMWGQDKHSSKYTRIWENTFHNTLGFGD